MHTDVHQKICITMFIDALFVLAPKLETSQMLLTVQWLKCVIFTKKYYITYYVTMSCSVATRFFVTPWVIASQAPQSVEFSRQEYWSGLPFPSPGDLPNPGIELGLLHCRQILYHLSHQGSPIILATKLETTQRLLPGVWLNCVTVTKKYHITTYYVTEN